MASGDTKTEALMNILENGGDIEGISGSGNTKFQDYIVSNIDSVNSAKSAIASKGGTTGDTGLAGLSTEIASIPSGGGATISENTHPRSANYTEGQLMDISATNPLDVIFYENPQDFDGFTNIPSKYKYLIFRCDKFCAPTNDTSTGLRIDYGFTVEGGETIWNGYFRTTLPFAVGNVIIPLDMGNLEIQVGDYPPMSRITYVRIPAQVSSLFRNFNFQGTLKFFLSETPFVDWSDEE